MTILLDIDGVMVSGAGWKTPLLLEDGFSEFMPNAVLALSKLLEKECSVILTTSHRFRYSTLEWKKIFQKRNLLIDDLSILESRSVKKEALLEWFKENESDDFIIIDDDTSLNSLPLHLKERLILTSPLKGLTYENINWLD